jgi:hypothetical protein
MYIYLCMLICILIGATSFVFLSLYPTYISHTPLTPVPASHTSIRHIYLTLIPSPSIYYLPLTQQQSIGLTIVYTQHISPTPLTPVPLTYACPPYPHTSIRHIYLTLIPSLPLLSQHWTKPYVEQF